MTPGQAISVVPSTGAEGKGAKWNSGTRPDVTFLVYPARPWGSKKILMSRTRLRIRARTKESLNILRRREAAQDLRGHE